MSINFDEHSITLKMTIGDDVVHARCECDWSGDYEGQPDNSHLDAIERDHAEDVWAYGDDIG